MYLFALSIPLALLCSQVDCHANNRHQRQQHPSPIDPVPGQNYYSYSSVGQPIVPYPTVSPYFSGSFNDSPVLSPVPKFTIATQSAVSPTYATFIPNVPFISPVPPGPSPGFPGVDSSRSQIFTSKRKRKDGPNVQTTVTTEAQEEGTLSSTELESNDASTGYDLGDEDDVEYRSSGTSYSSTLAEVGKIMISKVKKRDKSPTGITVSTHGSVEDINNTDNFNVVEMEMEKRLQSVFEISPDSLPKRDEEGFKSSVYQKDNEGLVGPSSPSTTHDDDELGKENEFGANEEQTLEMLDAAAFPEAADIQNAVHGGSLLEGKEFPNATYLPIPKGYEVKSSFKKGKQRVLAEANITSSTQTVVKEDTTEKEKVVDRKMTLKIQDEKGISRGLKKVHIVDKVSLKQFSIKKLEDYLTYSQKRQPNRLAKGTKASKNHKHKHTRNKRSTGVFNDGQIGSIYEKKTELHLPTLTRKERVDGSRFLDVGEKKRSLSDYIDMLNAVRIFMENEVGEFLDSNISDSRSANDLPKTYEHKDFKFQKRSKYRSKAMARDERHRVGIMMNFINMKVKVEKEKQNLPPQKLKIVAVPTAPNQSINKDTLRRVPFTILEDKNNSESKTYDLMVTFLFLTLFWGVAFWFIKKRCIPRNRMARTYKIQHKPKEILFREDNYFVGKDARYPQMEWQMENGAWLAET